MKKYSLSLAVFLFVAFMLIMMQLKMQHPILLAERFLKGMGWIEIIVVSVYAAFVVYKMKDVRNVSK